MNAIDNNELARARAADRARARHDLIRRLGEHRAEFLLEQLLPPRRQEPDPMPVVHCFVDDGR